MGLLLLRAAVGLMFVVQGMGALGTAPTPDVWSWVVGLLEVVSGAALLVGFLTPLAAALAGLVGVGSALAWSPLPAPGVLDDKLVIGFLLTTAAAVVLVGPGALSVDARLFGRREIIIPAAPRSPRR